MARYLDMMDGAGRIWVEFQFDETCLDLVKCLPNRKYHADVRRWSIPTEALDEAIKMLEPLGFSLSPSVRKHLEERPEDASQGWTVGALNRAIDAVLKRNFERSLWVIGELSNYDKVGRDKPAFFDLIERDDAGNITSKLSAVAFWDARLQIKRTLDLAQASFEFKDGLLVRLVGQLSMSPKGRVSLRIQDIDPRYTVGELELRRERVMAELRTLGLHERNLNIPMPLLPMRVALITAEGSDAQADFLDELRRSDYRFQVTCLDARMQGKNTESTVLQALAWVHTNRSNFDVVAIVRGGGARADLTDFDTLPIGKSVCECAVKVVCGVGHQLDVCLLDAISVSQKTPTAAARSLVDRVAQSEALLDSAQERVVRTAGLRTEIERQRVDAAANRCRTAAIARTTGASRRFHAVARRVAERGQTGVAQQSRSLAELEVGLRHGLALRLERDAAALDSARKQLGALDPQRVLERGFAIIRQHGKVLRSIHDVDTSVPLQMRLADGKLAASIQEGEDDG